MNDLTGLHEALARVAPTGRDSSAALTEIATIAHRALPRADAAALGVRRGSRTITAASDGSPAAGAVVSAAPCGTPRDGVGHAGRGAGSRRTPLHGAGTSSAGTVLSMPLIFQSEVIGTLTFWSARPRAFDHDDVELAGHVAQWVGLAVGRTEFVAWTVNKIDNLHTAMASRSTIDQAKGILMERYRITEEQAFTTLVHASQTLNRKLRDIADHLVRTGELQTARPRPQPVDTPVERHTVPTDVRHAVLDPAPLTGSIR